MPDTSSPAQISGFATPEGTERYARRNNGWLTPADGHFRKSTDGLTLSSLGMGTYLGDLDDTTDAAVTRAVVDSVTSGAVNVLDTAINYRCQLAERSIGKAIRQLQEKGFQRDELFISTKNGYLTPDAQYPGEPNDYFTDKYLKAGVVELSDIAGGIHCMSPKFLAHELALSLGNLGLESIDLLYLHNAAESQLPAVGRQVFMHRLAEAFAFFEEARSAGKIRSYGLATWECFRVPEDQEDKHLSLEVVLQTAEQVGGADHGFRYIQLPFNLALTEAAMLENQFVKDHLTNTMQAAHDLGIGVFTSVPLMQGQLLNHPLPAFSGLQTSSQRCLQVVRSNPGILAPLVGQKSEAHVRDNLQVATVSPESPDALEAAVLATTAR